MSNHPAHDEPYVRVAALDELAPGELRRYEVDGQQRLLLRLEDGTFHALDGICTHQHAELADGELEDDVLWCPLHSSGFDPRTGEPTCPPAMRALCRYEVIVRDGQVLAARGAAP